MTISDIIKALEAEFNDLELEINGNLEFGTLSSKIAFKSKDENKKPIEVAQDYVSKINEFITNKKIDAMTYNKGPFINIKIGKGFYKKFLSEGVDQLLENNFKVRQNTDKIVLEFVSTNMAKPLHAGHLLQGNYGESLRKILSLKYPNLITNCFLGDWGVNLGTLIWGYKQILGKKVTFTFNGKSVGLELSDTPNIDEQVKTYVWANQQKEITDDFDKLVRAEHLKLENEDSQNMEIWRKIRKSTLSSTKNILKNIKVKDFDYYDGEHGALEMVKKLLEYLSKNNIGKVEGKGRYIQFNEIEDWENIPPYCKKNIKQLGRAYLLESKTGYTTYILRDVAAKINYILNHDIDIQYLFVGNEQIHNFYQVFAICDYISKKRSFIETFGENISSKLRFDNFKPIFNGMIHLPSGKMSTRKGNFLTANQILEIISNKVTSTWEEKSKNGDTEPELINSISNSALKWFNLNKEIATDTVLNTDEVINFSGNTGIYQLYTYTRLNSILENFKTKNARLNIDKLNESEIRILQKISLCELIVNSVTENHKIHTFTNYLFELCQLINSWYNLNSVLYEEDTERKESLIFMISKIKMILKNSLSLLGIDTVEKL